MGWITQTLGENKFDNYKLADNGDMSGRQYSLSKGIKATEPLVNFVDLEFAYKTDAITFNAINKSVQMIMSGGFKGFLHTKKNITTKFTKFFENIGEIGTDTTSDELLEGIFRDEMVYGNAFVEKIYDATDTKIVDLAMIDPKKIDYAKTDGGKIILDRNGSALGYTIKLESGTYAEGDIVPETYERTIKLGENDIFVLAKRIAHF